MKTALHFREQPSNQSRPVDYDAGYEIENFFEIKYPPTLLMPCFYAFS